MRILGHFVPKKQSEVCDDESQSAGFGEAPQQAFLQPPRDAKIASVATLALLAICALLSK